MLDSFEAKVLSSRTSVDGKFSVSRTRHTLELEEVPIIVEAAVAATEAAIKIFLGAARAAEMDDPTILAVEVVPAAVEFYEAAAKIKRELED